MISKSDLRSKGTAMLQMLRLRSRVLMIIWKIAKGVGMGWQKVLSLGKNLLRATYMIYALVQACKVHPTACLS